METPPATESVTSSGYWPPLSAAGIPAMVAGLPPVNDRPGGSLPEIAPIFPSLAEMANDPLDPTVNVAVLGLRNVGLFTTVTGNGVKTGMTEAFEPVAIGAISAVDVPVVPAGGLPNRVAVPFPLSTRRLIQGGPDLNFQETWVLAPVDASTTEFDAPATNIASLGGPKLAAGAGARSIPKAWRTVSREFDAVIPQVGLSSISTQKRLPGRPAVPLMVPVPLPLSLKINPGKKSRSPGSTDKLGGGNPVVVTWKLTGKPAGPVR